MRRFLTSIYLYPSIALFTLLMGMLVFYQYSIRNSSETILHQYSKKAKEDSSLLKSIIEELSLHKKDSLIQREIVRISSRANVEHVLLISSDRVILYADKHHYIGKKLEDIFSNKVAHHYEEEITNIAGVHVHEYHEKSIDIVININYLYNHFQNTIDSGSIIMLYDLSDVILQRKNSIKEELSYIFLIVSLIVFLLFYLYYRNFLIKLQEVEKITSSFNTKFKTTDFTSVNNILKHLTKTTTNLEIMSRVIRFSSDAIMITDKNKSIISINPAFEKMSGYAEAYVLGKKPEEFMKSNIQDDEFYNTMWSNLTKYGSFQGQLTNRKKDGSTYTVWQNIWSLKSSDTNKVTHYVAMSQDISKLVDQEKQIRHLAYYDALTSLVNRSYFLRILNKTIKRRKKEAFALLFIGLDNFKEINDTMGHSNGDIMLKEFANYLRANFCDTDIISRLGGDEFAIISYQVKEPEDALLIASKVSDFSKNTITINSKKINITLSIGISFYPEDGSSSKELLSAADLSMHRSKQEGKGKTTLFQEQMQIEANKKIHIKYELKNAIKNNEFILYYQPKYTTSEKRIVGFEALIRWVHPTKGFIRPDDFIPVAEESGLIVEITEWIFKEINSVCSEFSNVYNDFSIAINISAIHFKENRLIKQIESLIETKWIHEGHIELEVTESAVMHNIEETTEQLFNIKNLGIKISLDDYGTGHSSLAYLKNLPIDTIKIDKSFVDGICNNKKDFTIVKSTIELADSLGMSTTVEGVEDEEQLKYIKRFQATYIQGYIYSKPLEKEAAVDLLKSIV